MAKRFTLLKNDKVLISRKEKVIPAKEFAVLLDAEELKSHIELEIKELKKKTEKKCKELEAKARDAGFQEGLLEFNKHVVALEEKKRQLYHETQRLIIPLALKAAKKIVSQELKLNPNVIVEIVKQTLKPVLQNHRIRIFVNKEDRNVLESNKDSIKSILEQVETFSIEDRPDIEQGGCIIETEFGIINATLDNQWKALEAAFQGFMKN
ncbi:MAG: FliH/SctL family protein [Chlamydiales bacterium]